MKPNIKVSRIVLLSISFVVVAGLIFMATEQATATEPIKQQVLVDKARIIVNSFVTDPDMAWLRDHMREAKGILIVPSLLKAGFVFGGSGGRGVLLVQDEKTGKWSQPAFYNLGSVSWGIQIGAKTSEVVMMVMTQKGLESLYTSSFKLGGDASIAVGPVGGGAEAATAPSLKVDFISFARSKGAFFGFSLDGAIIKTNDEWNNAYYAKEVRPVDILVTHSVSNPDSAKLRAAVSKASHVAQKEAVPQVKGQYHEVQSGDTLNGISKKYSVPVDELCRLNNISKEKPIYPGQKILLAPKK